MGYVEYGEEPRGERGRFDSAATIVHEVPTTGFTPKAKPANAQVAPITHADT